MDRRIYEYWKRMPDEHKNNDLDFLNWFDIHENQKKSFASGYVDLCFRIIDKDILKIIQNPADKKCLEIGFGAGRILNAATDIFEYAYGVDIHNSFEKTKMFLKNENYKLLKPEEMNEEIEDASLDFVYSFIVFQHFHSIKTFTFYIEEISRILKPGSPFVIYYGENRFNNDDFALVDYDRMSPRSSTLFINPDFVQKSFQDLGFKVMKHAAAAKKPWVSAESCPSNCQRVITGVKQETERWSF